VISVHFAYLFARLGSFVMLEPSSPVFSVIDEESTLVPNRLWCVGRLNAESGQKFEVNHPPPLDVSHRPCRHMVLSPRTSNFMGVRVI